MTKKFNKIYIEVTNVCNLNCDFCPKTKRKLEFMSFDLFKKCIDESKPLCDEVTLHIMGEPMLHPNFKDLILYCEEKGVRVNLTTNGTLVKDYFDVLLNLSIRRINFSIHGLKSNFSDEKARMHLLNIIDFTKLAQEKRDELIIVYRLWNVGDVSNRPILDILDREFHVNLDEVNEKTSYKIKNNAFIHYDNSFEWPDGSKSESRDRGFCHALSTHVGILVDGTVVPCCLDSNGNIPLGSVVDDSISNIVKCKRAVDMRTGFKQQRLVEDMCKRCTFIKIFDGKLNKNIK